MRKPFQSYIARRFPCSFSICSQQWVFSLLGARESISLSVFCAPDKIILFIHDQHQVASASERDSAALWEFSLCGSDVDAARRRSLFLTLVYTMTGACTKKSRGSSSGPQCDAGARPIKESIMHAENQHTVRLTKTDCGRVGEVNSTFSFDPRRAPQRVERDG